MKIEIPKLSLVVLMGPSGAGKSTFARRHFAPTEVLSSDYFRGLVSDDENNQTATVDAFETLHYVAAKRLARGRLTVIDATNVQPEARAPLVALAREYHCLPVAIVLLPSESVCVGRNRDRADRNLGPHVVAQQRAQLRRSLRTLRREGFREVVVLDDPQQIDSAVVERIPLWNDRTHETGPFDIIGDVHGCATELETLLAQLGYAAEELSLASDASAVERTWGTRVYRHPAGRKAVFLGDLVDRGPRVLDVLRIVRNMQLAGAALCVPGNHDMKLLKKLRGRDVQVTHGLQQTLAELAALPDDVRPAFEADLAQFLDRLVSHYVLDGGRLVVAHAGLRAEMHGRGSKRVRDFALYGETTGETDEFGLPVRYNWAAEYRGSAAVVYGHTPTPFPEWLNGTVNVDTGCVFGGALTALRWPEREFASTPAVEKYCEPARPIVPAPSADARSAQHVNDDLLDMADVQGKRIVATRLMQNVTIRAENSVAALEVMSRFAANPKWLIYLPPTMSPSETSLLPGYLEHPAEALAYFRAQGCSAVIAEQKHMGSRAVVVVCRDQETARRRFGIQEDERGIIYTRTGRRFFDDGPLEQALLERLADALTAAGLWQRLETDWVCLDCELMPWSAKAQALLEKQYAAVGSSGVAALRQAVAELDRATQRPWEDAARESLARLSERTSRRLDAVQRFVAAYRQYCWDVRSLDDLQLAPFHLLASEGQVHAHQSHVWHMETLAEVCRHDAPLLLATPYWQVDVQDAESERRVIEAWTELTERGGEGMVFKPLDFLVRGPKGLAQPAIKCRGREYLRIIYGPEYDSDENLPRLRKRGLHAKRSLALREFALGIESLERFVRRDPLRRVHECVFGVLALESEPVDPRL
ncbi:MAG: polynucleotide kinase-phosphatase [Pirellulales bacterium]